jgi:iron(III) transport system substrate-binding protein
MQFNLVQTGEVAQIANTRHQWFEFGRRGTAARTRLGQTFLLLGIALAFGGCGRESTNVVVVYSAHDQIYSEPDFRRCEEKTGIRVKAVYDTESAKTVGLANRLAAESKNPQCDVFWNNEVVRTVMLKRNGVLERYVSESSHDIPAGIKGDVLSFL